MYWKRLDQLCVNALYKFYYYFIINVAQQIYGLKTGSKSVSYSTVQTQLEKERNKQISKINWKTHSKCEV